jgi:hypothetical protein
LLPYTIIGFGFFGIYSFFFSMMSSQADQKKTQADQKKTQADQKKTDVFTLSTIQKLIQVVEHELRIKKQLFAQSVLQKIQVEEKEDWERKLKFYQNILNTKRKYLKEGNPGILKAEEDLKIIEIKKKEWEKEQKFAPDNKLNEEDLMCQTDRLQLLSTLRDHSPEIAEKLKLHQNDLKAFLIDLNSYISSFAL